MSEPATPIRPFYVAGGTLKPGEPSYVERRADAELFESLLAGEFCYVLTARQMGKSSLMARTAKRLEEAGVRSAIVDLTQIGSEREAQAAAQWYFGIANRIHQQLGIPEPLRPWWQERADLSSVQRLTDFFREIVLVHCPGRVVIFVDEIDSTIGLPFADDFFAALRACFNARATEPAFERLTFVLLGVATPDQLIQDSTRTPFNIGKRIDLTDFSVDEARTLASGLHTDPEEAERRLGRVLHWTGGHPYLTQAVCRAVREKDQDGTEEIVDPLVEELFLTSRAQREETNLKHARARLEKKGPEGRRLLQLYRRVRQGKVVPDQPTSPLFAQLKLAGVVKATDEGRLAVRNRIYEAVFTPDWAKAAMPADRGRQLAAASLAASLSGLLVWYAVFQPRSYEEAFRAAIKDDGYNGAFEAYTALRSNPFYRSRATELMQEFWEQRALKYSLTGRRDESLLSYLQGLTLKDSKRLRKLARNLVGSDYERLQLTFRHADGVEAVAFSPDGGVLATGSEDNNAKLWDTRSGKLIVPPLRHQEAVRSVAFSPDGHTLATGSGNLETGGAVRLWDTRSKYTLLRTFQSRKPVYSVAFSPDGHTLATGFGGSYDSTELRNTHTWDIVEPDLATLPGAGSFVAFSPDSRAFATRSGNTTQLWDTHTGKLITHPLPHAGSLYSVAFSPEGRTLATSSGSLLNIGSIHFWNIRAGKPASTAIPYPSPVYDVTYGPDGRILATGSKITSQIWEARTGRPVTTPLRQLSIAETNDRSTSKGFTKSGWSRTLKSIFRFMGTDSLDDSASITVAFSPDGRTLGTGSTGDNTARLWNAFPEKVSKPLFHDQSYIKPLALSPNGQVLLTMSGYRTVRLWDARTRKSLELPLPPQAIITAAALSLDGEILAIAAATVGTAKPKGIVQLWDAHTGKSLGHSFEHNETFITAMAFSPDGRILATGPLGALRLWDTRSGKPNGQPLQQNAASSALAFSPDGRILASVSGLFFSADTVELWDVQSGKHLPPLQFDSSVSVIAFSPNGQSLAAGSYNAVRVWDVESKRPLTPPLALQGLPQTIAFMQNGGGFFVATDHWLNTYSWDGKNAVPQSVQLLKGFWSQSHRFPSDCERCLQVALGDTGNSFHLETLHLDEPTDPPIEGDPKELLEKWQHRLGLKFDEQMRPVPR